MATLRPPPRSRSDSEKTIDFSTEYPHASSSISYWQLLSPKGVVTKDVLNQNYKGAGTESDPFIISFIDSDPEDPKRFSSTRKWLVVAAVSFASFIAALGSSLYIGTINQIRVYFEIGNEVALLGVSLYVLGLAVGPLVWAPAGETYGRRMTALLTSICFTAFNGSTIAAQNVQSLIVLRFFAGAFASSPFVNAAGALADVFEPAQRGLAFGFYAVTPFLGPMLGPMLGGFLGAAAGWRWVLGMATVLSGLSVLVMFFLQPETFGAVILRRRAKAMSSMTGRRYVSRPDSHNPVSALTAFKKAVTRPWAILFLEPIVLLLSTWISVVYGTLYLILAGFPFIFEEARGWNAGQSGLALLGIAAGTVIAAIINVPISRRFAKKAREGSGNPEVRLQPAMIGGLLIPFGLFWFAWTTSPSIPWPASVVGSSFFGMGMTITWTSVNNYLTDAYKIYAASALAGQVVWRSIFGAVFPLFTMYMYQNLGLQWASSVPAFISLACAPMPFIFCKYGSRIREKSRYGPKVAEAVKALHEEKDGP